MKWFPGTTLALATALLLAGSPISAQAATVPFTFNVIYDIYNDVPTSTNLTVPASNSGSGLFAPFGAANYAETGTATFAILPSGDLVLSTVSLNFTASFNGGADTFTGTDFHVTGVSQTMTILGGTGIFSGATGTAAPVTIVLPPSGNTASNYAGTLALLGPDKSQLPA